MNGTLVCCTAGLGIAVGLLLVLAGGRRSRPAITARSARTSRSIHRVRGIQLTIAVGAGLVTAAATGWVVGGALTAAALWFLPSVVRPDRVHARRIARIEAVASWTEMLRDTLSAAAGLEQAVLATAPLAPAAIRGEVSGLALRLRSGHRLVPALRSLADELADPTADLVVASLILAAEHQSRQLGDLLGSLAGTARAQAAMRLRIETGRARTRTSVRVITATTAVFAAGIVILNRAYLAVYDSLPGQAVLLMIGTLFGGGFAWLSRIAAGCPAGRVLLPAGGESA